MINDEPQLIARAQRGDAGAYATLVRALPAGQPTATLDAQTRSMALATIAAIAAIRAFHCALRVLCGSIIRRAKFLELACVNRRAQITHKARHHLQIVDGREAIVEQFFGAM